MSSATKTILRPSHPPAAAGHFGLHGVVGKLTLAYKIYRERRALLGLSDYALKDIGLSRADAYREGERPIWELPSNR